MEAGGVLSAEQSPARSNLHVAFTEKGEVKEKRAKFLTAKYGSHQMSLIRKRLAVEMWLLEEIQKLYASGNEKGIRLKEAEIDIDELLDMSNDEMRKSHLQNLLSEIKKPNDVKKFINDLLEKTKTL